MTWHVTPKHSMVLLAYGTAYLVLRTKYILNLGPNAGKRQEEKPSCSMRAELYAAAGHEWCNPLHCSSKADILDVTLAVLYTCNWISGHTAAMDWSCTCCAGSCMHLPLLPGMQVHVSMPPHPSAPSPSVLQPQPPQRHQDDDQHKHPDSTALQGGQVRGGVKPGQKESYQGRRHNGAGQGQAYSMQQPSLKQSNCSTTSCVDMC